MMVEEENVTALFKVSFGYFFFEELGEMIYSLRIVIRKSLSSFLYSSLAIWLETVFQTDRI